MRSKILKKGIGCLIALLFLSVMLDARMQKIFEMPDQITLEQGEQKTLDFQLPFSATIEGTSVDVLKFNGESLKESAQLQLGQPVTIQPVGTGAVRLRINVLGFIPIKEVTIQVDNARKLIVGGQSVGVTLYTKGALVVGASELIDAQGKVCNPAQEADVLPGDVIIRANGIEIKNADHLSQIINEMKNERMELLILRDGEALTRSVQAVRDYQDGKYRLGIWVRDSTAGVGTLTFYDPTTKKFGSLGHAITDVDTHTNLSVKEGEIFHSTIIDVRQGVRGKPGELQGNFDDTQNNVMGRLESNTEYGIFGTLYEPLENELYPSPLPAAKKEEVETGPAKLLTTVDDTGMKEYDCEIIRVNRQDKPSTKGMVIKITDPKLLDRTGGIVQGMSGSPILQNGKIVGALTHVFVNDPTQGYAVFIEWMLAQTG
ncbi:MAG: SpoIVB peptidase [Bacillota bacterium]